MHLGSWAIDDSLTFTCNTHSTSTGAATDADAAPAYRIYEDETGTPILTGTMALLDDAGTTGFYSEQVTLSAANGLEYGKAYSVYIEAAVGGVTGSISHSFQMGGSVRVAGTLTTLDELDTAQDAEHLVTQTLVGNLSVGSGGISTVAGANSTVTTGTPTNAYTDTATEDGTYHSIAAAGGLTELMYEFDIGPNGVPQSIDWIGYAQANNDTYLVNAYNWVTLAYEQIGTIAGANGAAQKTQSFNLTTAHVGTGANDGTVRWQVTSADGNNFATDRLLCSYTVIAASLGYDNAAVWVDEIGGTSSGTTAGIDALVTNRADDFDNAVTVAAALGYTRVEITAGNSITLSATLNGYVVNGSLWTLALGGQDIGASDFIGATVSGVATGTTPQFDHCIMGAATLPPSRLFYTALTDTLTVGSAGNFQFIDCRSGVAGSGSPTVDLAAAGATTIEFRRWSGGLSLVNVAAGDVISVDAVSGGTITINGTGGTVHVRGLVAVTDSSGGSVTIVQTQAVSNPSINAEADTALTDYDPPTKTEQDTAFTEIKGATWASGTDTLEAIRDRGDTAWVTGGSGSLRLAKATATYNSATKELRLVGWLELAGELQDATAATLSLKSDSGAEIIADGSFTKAENADYTWLWTLADGSAINAVKNYVAEFTFTVGGTDYTRSVGFAGQGA